MTDLMQTIYNYIQEKRFQEFLPQEYHWTCHRALNAADKALRSSLSAEQWSLFEAYMDTQSYCCIMEQEALFLAAWSAFQELR